MNASAGNVFSIRELSGSQTTFVDEEDVAGLEHALWKRLKELPEAATLSVSFAGVTIASGAARKLLERALRRVQSGELRGRALVLDHIRGTSSYNVRAMLISEKLWAVARIDGKSATLIGDAKDDALKTTFEFVASRDDATARDVQDHFKLNTVAAATNRLARLQRIGAVRRDGPRPLEGGGIEYVFTAVAR